MALPPEEPIYGFKEFTLLDGIQAIEEAELWLQELIAQAIGELMTRGASVLHKIS